MATHNQLQEILRLTQTFSRDIKMAFEIEKCKTLCIAKGKLEMRNFITEADDTMEAMNEDDTWATCKLNKSSMPELNGS